MKTAFPIRPRPGGEDAMGLGTDVGSALIGELKQVSMLSYLKTFHC